MSRALQERFHQFSGLNDRDYPSRLAAGECPDLRNVDLSERTVVQRNGFSRVHTSPMRDASVRFNGVHQYGRIEHESDYEVTHASDERFFVSWKGKLNAVPTTANDVTILSKGFGSSTSLSWRIFFDRSLNSNIGGWGAEIYDSTGGALRTFGVNDPQAGGIAFGQEIVGQIRHIELGWYGSGNTYELRVYDAEGAAIGTHTGSGAVTEFNNPAADPSVYIGVNTTAAETVGTEFASVTVSEIRLCVFDDTTYTTGCPLSVKVAGAAIADRELDSVTEVTASYLVGYWKCNDGTGTQLADSTSASNAGVMNTSHPEWVFGSANVLGNSGLRFYGLEGFVHWKHRNGATFNVPVGSAMTGGTAAAPTWSTPTVASIFQPSSRTWTFEFLFTPIADAAGTVPDQVIFWMGDDEDLPEPLGVVIERSGGVARFKAYYNGAGTAFSTSAGSGATALPDLDGYLGTRIRVTVRKDHSSATAETLSITMRPETGGDYYGVVAVGSGVSGGSPSAVSADWSIGRKMSSFAYPYTVHGVSTSKPGDNQPCRGVVDDFRLFRGVSSVAPGGGPYPTPAFQEVAGWGFEGPGAAVYSIAAHLRLNDGGGNKLQTEEDFATWVPTTTAGEKITFTTATLEQERNVDWDDVYWDHGMVEPYDPPECRMLFDYRKFSQDQTQQTDIARKLLAVSGCTLHGIDLTAGTTEILSGGLAKGGMWTADQREDTVYLASRNGRRPVAFSGGAVRGVGIRAPTSSPTVSPTAGGGSWVDGNHYVYVTYYNTDSGAESNPSPGVLVDFDTNDRIVSGDILLPVSPDPQVNARRIWMTGVAGADGDSAFLFATETNNDSVSYSGATLTVAPTSGASMLYFDNDIAPLGGVVTIWNDRLWVAGHAQYPTRVYYSQPGRTEAFDLLSDYVDLDNDSGDPVTALKPRLDVVSAYTRDGRWDLWTTGIADDPVDRRQTNDQSGAVGPLAVQENVRQHIIVSERHVFQSDGYNDRSISSPPYRPPPSPNPSCEYFLRNNVADSRRELVSVAVHRSKNQVWICMADDTYSSSEVRTNRNNTILTYDVELGVWSRYAIDCDIVAEVEDDNDSTWIYGAVRGHVVKLDTGSWDGFASLTNGVHYGTVTASGTTTSLTMTGTPFSGLTLKGHHIYVYDVSPTTGVLKRAVIRSNTNDTLNFYEALGFDVDASDVWTVGAFPSYADFIVAGTRQDKVKRLRSVVFAGRSDSDNNDMRMTVYPDEGQRTVSETNKIEIVKDWLATRIDSGSTRPMERLRFPGGGSATMYRVRVAPVVAGLSNALPADPLPSPTGRVEVYEFVADWILTDAR